MKKRLLFLWVLIGGNVSAQIAASPDTAICTGNSVQLNATGGNLSYSWTPTTGLSNPNIANPIVAPSVTTSYVVRTMAATGNNLVANGDFEQGNTGFTTTYSYVTGLPPSCSHYTVDGTFSGSYAAGCSPHGGGLMLWADGTDQGTPVWCQNITVVPNTDYAFSAWLENVGTNGSPAQVAFSINGVQVGATQNTSSVACQWNQFYTTWNSGSNTTVDVCITDTNTSCSGNDFGLDDIVFQGISFIYDTVTITVNQNYTVTRNDTICTGQSFTLPNGTVVNQSGTYINSLQTVNGCDSIITTNLALADTLRTTINAHICPNASYTLPNGNIVGAGIYTDTLQTSGGCDSISTIIVSQAAPAVHISRNAAAPCDTSQLDWATWTNVTSSNATGNIGANLSMTVSQSGGGLSTTPGIFNPTVFPTQYNVPVNNTAIRNDNAGIFTACFSHPVTNPQVAFSSIGGNNTVTITTSAPYEIIWQGQAVSYPNDTTIVGTEGYTIVRFPGTHNCISFNYHQAETYCNLAFGVQDINCQNLPITECAHAPADTLHAIGAATYSWTPSAGLNTTTGATVIARPTTTTTYHVTGYDSYGCSATDSFTIIIATNADTTYTTSAVCNASDSGITVHHLINQYGCDSVIIDHATVFPNSLSVSNDTSICTGNSVQLNATGGNLSYSWTPTTGLSNSNIANPIAAPSATTQYIVHSTTMGTNLIVNGDFEQGNSGFSSGYPYSNPNPLAPPGNYTVSTSVTNSWWPNCADHTTGTGVNMMIVDGADGTTLPVGTTFWCQTVNVTPNTNYVFSTWLTNLNATGYTSQLSFRINGTQVGSIQNTPLGVCQWNQFYELWNSGSNTSVNICMAEVGGLQPGNDFAIDDISFSPICDVYDTVTITVNPISRDTQNVVICQGESFTRPNGIVVNTSGSWIDTLQSVFFCDSIITTNLTVNSTYNSTQNPSICSFFTFTRPNGTVENTSGSWIDTLQTVSGCDSIITTNLTVIPASDSTVFDTICSYQTYTLPNGGIVNSAGIYTDSFSAANGCKIITTHLAVSSLSLSAAMVSASCFGGSDGSISVTTTGGISPVQYSWSDTAFAGTLISNVSAGTYTLTATDNVGCSATNTISVSQPSALLLSATYTEPFCYGEASGTLTATAQNGNSPYLYSIVSAENNSNGMFQNLTAGNYSISVIDSRNCTAQMSVTVTQPDSLEVYNLPAEMLGILNGVYVPLSTNYSTNIAFSWNPRSGVSCATCPNPILNPDSATLYTLTVSVFPHGKNCYYPFPVFVSIDRTRNVYIPNAFSPNGNSENDYWQIFGSPQIFKQVFVQVFNRWGEKVFESNDENFRWDGRFKGALQPPGIYVYALTIVFTDNKTEHFKGSITVVR